MTWCWIAGGSCWSCRTCDRLEVGPRQETFLESWKSKHLKVCWWILDERATFDNLCRTKPYHLKWLGYRIGWDGKTGNLTCCSRIKWVTAIGKIWKATKFGKWCLFKKGRDCQLTPTATEAFRRCWKMVDDSMVFFWLSSSVLLTCYFSAVSWEFWFVVLE